MNQELNSTALSMANQAGTLAAAVTFRFSVGIIASGVAVVLVLILLWLRKRREDRDSFTTVMEVPLVKTYADPEKCARAMKERERK